MSDEYLAVNRDYWDDRAPAHASAAEYGRERFVADAKVLSDVVEFDRARLGDISGLRGLHLQCHIGTDTLSLHRLGARMTGLDLSPVSLREARAIAAACNADIDYVEAESYRAVEVLGTGRFDLVYSSIGTLLWLPDIAKWGRVVAELLAPGGRLFIRDTHPMVAALDAKGDDAVLRYPYFTQTEPLIFDGTETYVETDAPLADLPSWEWSHGIGEILSAVLDAGLHITAYTEHDSVPYRALDHLMEAHPDHPGEFHLGSHPERLAASFTLQARAPE